MRETKVIHYIFNIPTANISVSVSILIFCRYGESTRTFITPLSHNGLMYLYLKMAIFKLLITIHIISLRHLLITIVYGQLLCLDMKP